MKKRMLMMLGLLLAASSCLEVPAAGSGACPVDVDSDGTLALASFTPVSLVLEQRCGSLDCHGNIARPLRIYGSRGLRYVPIYAFDDKGNVIQSPDATAYIDPTKAEADGAYPGAGGKATTDAEHEQTVRALCGLQPEKMRQVVFESADPDKLLLMSKPLNLERHNGAKVFERGSLDHACITSWLQSKLPNGAIDVASCNETLRNP